MTTPTTHIAINKLPQSFSEGDWHDRPLRWEVVGPGTERQCFPTKREAALYRSIRRRTAFQGQAINKYASTL